MPKHIRYYIPLVLLPLLAVMMPGKGSAQSLLPLDNGIKNTPLAITGFDGSVYTVYLKEHTQAFKIFTVAKWDGSVWSFLPDIYADTASEIMCMRFYNGVLHVGGSIRRLNGGTNLVGHIIRFAPLKKTWESAGSNITDNGAMVTDLEIYKGLLFAAGKFRVIQNLDTANNVLVYGGQVWQRIKSTNKSSGAVGYMYDLHSYGDTLAMAGYFSMVNSTKSRSLVLLKDTVLYPVANSFQYVKKLGSYKDKLFCFATDSVGVTNIFCRAGKKMVLANNGLQGVSQVYGFAEFENELWAAGIFKINNQTVTLIKWNGTQWTPAIAPPLLSPTVLSVVRGQLFIGGTFEAYNKIILNRIARFDRSLVKVIGRVFFDKDNNCTFNATSDPLLSGRTVVITPGDITLKTNDNGQFIAILPAGTYTIKHLAQKYWVACGSGSFTVNYLTVKDTMLNFGTKPLNNSINDIRVSIVGNTGWKARKGYTETYSVTYENVGTTDVSVGNLNLGYNKAISFSSASEGPSSNVPGTLNWLYSNLKVGEKRTIDVDFKVPSIVNTDSLSFTANSYFSATDNFTDDNYDTLDQTLSVQTIGGNAKLVYPEPAGTDSISYILPDEKEVDYLIKFENTGTDTVRTLYIIDTIDVNLNIQYTQETGASHPYTTQVVNCDPSLGKGVLIWTFDNINLPPSVPGNNDYTANRGHIGFKVEFKSPMTPGYAFKNKANIVFDYDLPMQTNYTYCQVKAFQGIHNIDMNNLLQVYPNPAQNVLHITNTKGDITLLTLADMTGKTVVAMTAEGQPVVDMNVQDLPKGVYCLQAITAGGLLYRKVILE